MLESAKILGLNLNGNSLPANPFLEYDAEKSQSTGLDIYSYEYTYEGYDYYGSYVYQDGKYYSFYTDTEYKYDAEIRSLADCIKEWKITNMSDFGYNIYPSDDTPSEIHGKIVYKFTVSILSDDRKYSGTLNYSYYDNYITVYGFFLDGKLQILTGAVTTGASLVTFEGYKPFDEYMSSLNVSVVNNSYSGGYYFINGEEVYVQRHQISLTEPDYDVSYSLYLPAIGNDQYVYSVQEYYYRYLTLGDEVAVPEGYEISYEYTNTYDNGTYTMVELRRYYTETSKYYAVKLDGIFYSYDNYMYHLDRYEWYGSYGSIVNYETFRQQMYNTDRVYRVYDYHTGEYLYYNKFIPGAYFEGDELLEGFVLEGEIYGTTTLGYTEDGHELVEILYYINGENSKVQQITLRDGKVMYHNNGIGFVKFDDNMYVKAVLSYDNEGRAYARYLFTRAYRSFNSSELDAYFNRTDTSITITREMFESMSELRGTLFYIVTPVGNVYFDYYKIEAYFNGEVS